MKSSFSRFALHIAAAVFLLAPAYFLWSSEEAALAPAYVEAFPVAPTEPEALELSAELAEGETLTGLFGRTDFEPGERLRAERILAGELDLRRLRPGLSLNWRREGGVLQRISLALDRDRMLTILPDSSGEWQHRVDTVATVSRREMISGVITSSLYSAMLEASAESPIPEAERRALVDILAERVFAWQIDFSRDLRPDDRFWILYDREVRPDGTARSAVPVAVQFEVAGSLHEAYRHTTGEDGEGAYFDREGESLKRMFLRAPLEFRRISSGFNPKRFHPILKRNRPHNGVDYAAVSGTPVRATADGVVASAGQSGGYGNLVEIRHSRGMRTRYAHLSRFAGGIRAGRRVEQGEIIGYVGRTGLATAPHLHYEIHKDGSPTNPASVAGRQAAGLGGSERSRFMQMAVALATELDEYRTPAQATSGRMASRTR